MALKRQQRKDKEPYTEKRVTGKRKREVRTLNRSHGEAAATEGRDVALKFLQAINHDDAEAFWGLLDRKGQGYFIGMWFLAMANADIRTIEGLSGDRVFLSGALGPIIGNLKNNLCDLIDSPSFGDLIYTDGRHVKVPLLNTGGGREESIPLVLELAGTDNAEASLTCWKVDTLSCIQFGKG